MCVSCEVCLKLTIIMHFLLNFCYSGYVDGRVILLHFGRSVIEQFELVGMRRQVVTF
jgi:hypothetical protein